MSAIFGEILVFGQQQGPNIELRVYGDEFYARYETKSGYTVVYDLDRGLYCYATLVNGTFVSTGTPTNKPAPQGLPRHLREDRSVRNVKFSQRYHDLRPPEPPLSSGISRTFGPNNGLLSGRQVNRGQVRGLTILVDFQDLHTNVSKEDVVAMLNDLDYTQHGNHCSVRQYFQLMSDGKLDYTNDVVGPVRLSRKRSYYINTLLAREALEIAIRDFNVNLSNYDSQDQGTVDALSFMYAGRTQYSGNLWPHNSILRFSDRGTSTQYYTIQSLGRSAIDLSIGTFTHESGHMLCRWPDLYDYGERDGDSEASSGLGKYCLMSWGNHLAGGKTPSPVCAYLRELVNWCDEQVSLNNSGEFVARHAEYGRVLRYSTDLPNEYFLVENRSQSGLDQFLPASGLAVYHCDTQGSNEYQDGTPDNHYQCALLQADGRFDLEHNSNGGDAFDLFKGSDDIALSDQTVPSSRAWDGSDSGFILAKIVTDGDAIRFNTGIAPVPTGHTSADVTVVADLLIPDNDPQGVVSPLFVEPNGRLHDLRVRVDITHSYRGDLHVQLVSPSGTLVNLHRGTEGHLDDLHLDLSSQDHADLQRLRGEEVAGEWQLKVQDRYQDDMGRLDQWGLVIDYDPGGQEFHGENEQAVPIPDDDRNGVRSEIALEGPANAKDLSVSVEISHSYRGDLQLDLIAPSGAQALLRARNGDSSANLVATYDPQNAPALEGLIGEAAAGVWTLWVRDLARFDSGTLDRWSLTVVG